MEEEKQRGKEYYQVNLDTGRIFWIAFIIGLVIIGIFIFGFLIGGGEGKNQLIDMVKSGVFRKEKPAETKKNTEELKALGLLDEDLDSETRYIDTTSLEAARKGSPKIEKQSVSSGSPVLKKEAARKTSGSVTQRTVKNVSSGVSYKKPRRTVVTGDYFIQVASFEKKENAERLVSVLEKNLYKVIVEKASVEGKHYYRVQVGPFEKKSVAVNTMTAMKRRFDLNEPFVVKKSS
jgi:cell division septation protein DedD